MSLPSNKFSLKKRDWLRGLLVTVGTAFLTGITTSLMNGALPGSDQLKVAGIAGLGAGATYITKNWFTNDVPAAQKTITEAQEKLYTE